MVFKCIFVSFSMNQRMFLKTTFTLFLALLFSLKLQAQETNKSILLRGKASTFFVVEDIFFQNWNIGVEYRFAENHSVGLDFVHFRWRYEQDVYIDDIEMGYGPDSFSRRRYLLIDYRYYPFRNLMQEKYIDPYLNPFVKVGKRKIWTNDPTVLFGEHDIPMVKNHRADFTDYGLALGLRSDFVDRRFGFDVNIGLVYRETRVRYEKRYDFPTDTYSEHSFRKYYNWHPHMRLNFFMRICTLK